MRARTKTAVRIVSVLGIIAGTFGTLALFDSLVPVYALYILGGAFFISLPFDRKRLRRRWARGLFVVSGLLLLVMGAVGIMRLYAIWLPPLAVQHAFLNLEQDVRGVVLGFLLALVVSGELIGRKVSSDQPAM